MPVASDPQFGITLKRLRTDAGLSQAALADLAGISDESIRLIEKGEREPNWSTVRKLARALNVSIASFDESPPPPSLPQRPRGKKKK